MPKSLSLALRFQWFCCCFALVFAGCGKGSSNGGDFDGEKAPYGPRTATTQVRSSLAFSPGNLLGGTASSQVTTVVGQKTIAGTSYDRLATTRIDDPTEGGEYWIKEDPSGTVAFAGFAHSDLLAGIVPAASTTFSTPIVLNLNAPIGQPQAVTAIGTVTLPDTAATSSAHLTGQYTLIEKDTTVATGVGPLSGCSHFSGQAQTDSAGVPAIFQGKTITAELWHHPSYGVVAFNAPEVGIGTVMTDSNDCGALDASNHRIIRKTGVVNSSSSFNLDTYECDGNKIAADKNTHASLLLELRWVDEAQAKTDTQPMPKVEFGTTMGYFPNIMAAASASVFHPEENGKGFKYWYSYVNQAAKNSPGGNSETYHIKVGAVAGLSPVRVTARIYYKVLPEELGAMPDAGMATGSRTDGGITGRTDSGRTSDTSDAGCTIGSAMSAATASTLDVFGTTAYFNGGAPLPAGRYRLRYIDGCMKYGSAQGWTVNARASGSSCWFIVGATTSEQYAVPPGNVGYDIGAGGFANFEDCVAASRAVPPVEFNLPTAGPVGVWLSDSPYSDNLSGVDGRNPKWEIDRVTGDCPASTNRADAATPDAGPGSRVDAATPDTGSGSKDGPSNTSDAGCTIGSAMSAATASTLDVFGTTAYFNGGAPLPAGRYRLRYIDGCMKYGSAQGWTVNARASGSSCWFIVGATTSEQYAVPPGNVGYDVGAGGFANFEDCVAASRAVPPVEFNLPTAGPVGVWLSDSPYSDNLSGVDGRNPKWEIDRVTGDCPASTNRADAATGGPDGAAKDAGSGCGVGVSCSTGQQCLSGQCCTPPAAGGDCTTFPACGCPAGQVCAPATTHALACFTGNNLAEGADCSSGLTCRAGFGCFDGLCRPYCNTDVDCTAVAGVQSCLPTYWDTAQTVSILGVKVCARICDPTRPQSPRAPFLSCPTGFSCGTSPTGASSCFKATPLPAGSACTSTVDCPAGYSCTGSSATTLVCKQNCFASSDCATGTTCQFGWSPKQYAGNQEVGYCQ